MSIIDNMKNMLHAASANQKNDAIKNTYKNGLVGICGLAICVAKGDNNDRALRPVHNPKEQHLHDTALPH